MLLAAYQNKPYAAASLQHSMLAFWENIAATLLQPEQPLQDYAAFACGLHCQGRLLLVSACMRWSTGSAATGMIMHGRLLACTCRQAWRAAGLPGRRRGAVRPALPGA